jgi:hypothetical protein
MMHITHNHLTGTFLGFAAILTLACSDSIGPPAPPTGALAITVVTSGAAIDVDPDGYTIIIDGGAAVAIAVSGAVTIVNLATGNHSVRLDGLTPNCSISGTNPRYAAVTAGGSASLIAFDVSCVATPFGGDPSPWDY